MRKYNNITEEILYQRTKSCHRKKLTVTERNRLTQEEIYFRRKKFTVAGRNLLLQEEIYRITFDVTGKNIGMNFVNWEAFLLKKRTFCHR